MTDIIPVSDRAREAAVEYLKSIPTAHPDQKAIFDAMAGGRLDDLAIVKAFARFEHDLSTDKERLIEALRTAAKRVVDGGRLPQGRARSRWITVNATDWMALRAALQDHQS